MNVLWCFFAVLLCLNNHTTRPQPSGTCEGFAWDSVGSRAIICEQVRGPWGHSLCFISMQWGGHFAFRAWMPPWDGLSLISAGGVWCRIKTPHILASATSSRSSLDFPLSHYLFILIEPTFAAFKSLMILMWLVCSTKECVRILGGLLGEKHWAIKLYSTFCETKQDKRQWSTKHGS